MANIGLKEFTYAEHKGAGKYDTPAKLAGAIECKVSAKLNEASLYYDDQKGESAVEVGEITITLGIDNDDATIFAKLLGNETKQLSEGVTGTEVTQKVSDIAMEVGFGHIVSGRKNNKPFYRAVFYPRVIFKPYTVDAKTKGDSLEFTTPEVEGTVIPLDGVWRKIGTFETEDAAKTYLTSCFPTNAI